jgi:hypothetical protein
MRSEQYFWNTNAGPTCFGAVHAPSSGSSKFLMKYVYATSWVWAGQISLYSDWLWAGQSRDRIPVGARFFAHVQIGPGAHPASCTVGTGYFLGVKRPERGADHTPPYSAKVENESSYTATPPLGPWWAVIGWPLPYVMGAEDSESGCWESYVRLSTATFTILNTHDIA